MGAGILNLEAVGIIEDAALDVGPPENQVRT
jgi:hypothetical protein